MDTDAAGAAAVPPPRVTTDPCASAQPIFVLGTAPASGAATTSLALLRADWWEQWWDPKRVTPDVPALHKIFGPNFATTKTLKDCIDESGKLASLVYAAFGVRPGAAGTADARSSVHPVHPVHPVSVYPVSVYRDLERAGWLLGETLPKQRHDPTYALGVLLGNATLLGMARRSVPVTALFSRVCDTLVASVSLFRAGYDVGGEENIPRVDGLRARVAHQPSVIARAAADARKAATEAAARQAASPKDTLAAQDFEEKTHLSTIAGENDTTARASAAAVDNAAKAAATKHAAYAAWTRHPSHETQSALDNATQAEAAANGALDALSNDNLVGGWEFDGSNDSHEPEPEPGAELIEKRIYWAGREIFREGRWDAINAYDGTFTYGAGFNMSSGEGEEILLGLADPSTVPHPRLQRSSVDEAAFVAGCANTCAYLKKCGIWFGKSAKGTAGADVRLLHVDASGAGYLVDNSQLSGPPDLGLGGKRSVMRSAYKYLTLNRKLIEAFIRAGADPKSQPKLPGEPATRKGALMPSGDVMRTIQLGLFERNRMASFTHWNACATQACFFLLVHANHFGSAYRPDAILEYGVRHGIIPGTLQPPADPSYVAIGKGMWLQPSPTTDVKIARAAMTYMTTLDYKHKKKVTYDGSDPSPSTAAYFDLWTAFVKDILDGNAHLGEPGYAPPAAPAANGASAAGAAFPAPTSPNDPEPLPLRPWRQWLPQGASPGKHVQHWVLLLGRQIDVPVSAWDAVRYLVILETSVP